MEKQKATISHKSLEKMDLRGNQQFAAECMKAALGLIFAPDPNLRGTGLVTLGTLAEAYGVPNAVFGKLFDQLSNVTAQTTPVSEAVPERVN